MRLLVRDTSSAILGVSTILAFIVPRWYDVCFFCCGIQILPGEVIPGRSGGTLPDTSLLALRISFNPS